MKYLKYLFIISILSSISMSLMAQTHRIKGYVFDDETRKPIQGANVMPADASSFAVTDSSGFFRLTVKKAKGSVHCTLVGYKMAKVEYNVLENPLKIAMSPKPVSLNAVTIKSFNSQTKKKATPAAITVLKSKRLHQGAALSLKSSLNSIPGVRMDQTGVAEGRLSIRGMGARSPWGIRKTRVYLDGIPLTGADGITSWDDINVNALGRAEVIRGPSSSIYGSGTTGGVINFEMKRAPYGKHEIGVSAIVGSYGLHRSVLQFESGAEKMSSYISAGYQELGGYRAHSKDIQRFFTGNFQFYPSNKQTISLLIYHASQNSQLPGDLTHDEVLEDRKQASAISLDKDTRRNIKRTRIGINQKYDFNNHFSNSTSIYTYFMDFKEPLSYGVPSNFTESMGGRTYFTYQPGFASFDTKFIVGAEINNDRIKSILYDNVHGEPGDIWSNLDYTNTLYTVFYQSETELTPKAKLTLGLSYSGLNYDVKDYLVEADNGVKRFGPKFSPRIALSYDFGSALSLHGSVSTGYNPPNTEEISNIDQTINENIGAEKAINYEIDAKGNLLKNRLNYDVALFYMDMKGELIGQSPQQGVTIYHNSGKTVHRGVELSLSYQLLKKADHSAITSLKPYLSLTYSHFRFEDFKILDKNSQVKENDNGNMIPGIGPWMVYFGISLETKLGIYFSGNYHYNDKYALNDQNTAFNPAYQLVNAKIGYKTSLLRHFDVNVYAGIKNLTNTSYSSFTEINAEASSGQPAYFQPSPGMNGYGGLSLKYHF